MNNSLLLDAARYVNTKYLSKPYRDFPKEFITVDGYHIYRPNHGLAHTIRKMMYVRVVFSFFQKMRKTVFNVAGRIYSLEDELEHIELAMLFFVTGRESEVSFKDNPDLYNRYRVSSSERFEQYVSERQKIFPQIAKMVTSHRGSIYKHIIHEPHTPTSNPFYDTIKSLMRIIHQIDLFRCYDDLKMDAVTMSIANELNCTPTVNLPFMQYAVQCLQATGDLNLGKKIGRNSRLFLACSTSVTNCLTAISKVQKINYSGLPAQVSAPKNDSFSTGMQFFAQKNYAKLSTVSIKLQLKIHPLDLMQNTCWAISTTKVWAFLRT